MKLAGRRIVAALGVLSAWVPRVPGLAEACSVCVGPGSEERGLGAGFYWSALLLTLLPFVLAAALAVSFSGIVRRARLCRRVVHSERPASRANPDAGPAPARPSAR